MNQGMMQQNQQQAAMAAAHVGGPTGNQVVGPSGVPVGVPGQGPMGNAGPMSMPGQGPMGQVGPAGVPQGRPGGQAGPTPQLAAGQGPALNTASICRYGLELVQDIMSRATEVFLLLKSLQVMFVL